MARPLIWFVSPLSILKLCQLVCLVLVVVFFIDGRIQWKIYSVIYALAFTLSFGCILNILLHYFEAPKIANTLPWMNMELLWNATGLILCILSSTILIWDWWRMYNGHLEHHATLPPRNIGESRWQRRVAINAGSLFLAACLFLFVWMKVRKTGIH